MCECRREREREEGEREMWSRADVFTDGRLSHQCDCTAQHRLLHINCYNNVLASNEPRANQSADCDTPPPSTTLRDLLRSIVQLQAEEEQ